MSTQLQLPYKSVPEMFLHRVQQTPAAKAFAYAGPDGPVWLSWKTVGERATAIAAGLHALGVAPQDGVAIAATTRVEWVLADLGTMCAGAATTTVYPTTEAKDAAFILADSGVKVLIAEDATQVAKTEGASLPNLTHIVVIDGAAQHSSLPVLTLTELEEKGRGLLAADPELI
jgi:long-chain acyl-CoA synthetase